MAGKNLDNLITIVIAVAIIIFVAPVIWGKFSEWYLLKFGINAKAKIIDITDTGNRYNSNPVVKIKLAVIDNAGRERLTDVTMPVSPVRLVKYQPGYLVTVKYDPKSPDRVAIDSSVEPIKYQQ
jgi:hypothetical protein